MDIAAVLEKNLYPFGCRNMLLISFTQYYRSCRQSLKKRLLQTRPVNGYEAVAQRIRDQGLLIFPDGLQLGIRDFHAVQWPARAAYLLSDAQQFQHLHRIRLQHDTGAYFVELGRPLKNETVDALLA